MNSTLTLTYLCIRINRFVELQPRVKKHYGFQEDTSRGEMMMNKHAEGIVSFFDSVLQLLGKEDR